MKYLMLILILPLAISCKTQKNNIETPDAPVEIAEEGSENDSPATTAGGNEGEAVEDGQNDSYTKPQKPYRVKATFGETGQKTDYYTILKAEIEGTLLIMDIEYSGGCAWHKYEFIGSRAVSKSLPPQRSVQLLHDNGDDQCEAIVKQTIEIDITEMAHRQTSGSEIILNLEGYDEPLKFVYP